MSKFSVKRKLVVTAFLIGLAGFLFQIGLQQRMRPFASKDGYFHRWTSEHFMQALPIEDLRDEPFITLLSNHIVPPVFDAIRAVLANMYGTPDPRLLTCKVDHSLYVLGAILCGLIGVLVFYWLAYMTRIWFAAFMALFFIAHPACAFYATFLDSTLLSSALILWMYYLLWRFRRNPKTRIILFTTVVLVLFFTRAIFQLPFFLFLTGSLTLLKVPIRKVSTFLAITVIIAGLYVEKQYIQFGILTTSSFSGLNLARSIGMSEKDFYRYWKGYEVLEHTELPRYPLPDVMLRKWKCTNTPNFNHIGYLQKNKQLMKEFRKRLIDIPIPQLVKSYVENIRLYFEPSFNYEKGQHVIINHLWWRDLYSWIFSFPILPVLILFAGVVWILTARRMEYPAGISLILPGLYIFIISVLCDKGENQRYSFFLEPVFFVFITSQFYVIGERIYKRLFAPHIPPV